MYTTKKNGILLSSDPDIKEISDAINSIRMLDHKKLEDMRKSSYDKWSRCFDSSINAKEFCRLMKKLAGSNDQELVVVTNGYPYIGERSFIESEFVELCKEFDVTVFALKEGKLSKTDVETYENNITRVKEITRGDIAELEVHAVDMSWSIGKFLKYIPRYLLDSRIREERSELKHFKKNKWLAIWESVKYYAKAEYFWDYYKDHVFELDKSRILYTFWYTYATLGFCLNKDTMENSKIVTRAHGYDLYDERIITTNRQPFRETMEKHLDAVVFICKVGKEYYLNRNNLEDIKETKIVRYIGTKSPIKSSFSNGEVYKNDSETFRIVSCSSLIPLKRVDRIIDAIALAAKENPKGKIEWVHFGDGELGESYREYAGRLFDNMSKVIHLFMGKVDNDFIHRYYSENKVDCFITTSSTEGLPVSILEAMSYGIPIIATDVGGIKEVFEG